ncbi:MAG: hypothetical protein AABZ05_07825 [Nitrospirota bacterium]
MLKIVSLTVKPIVKVTSERSKVNGGMIPIVYPFRKIFDMIPSGEMALNIWPRRPPKRPPSKRNIIKNQVDFVDVAMDFIYT